MHQSVDDQERSDTVELDEASAAEAEEEQPIEEETPTPEPSRAQPSASEAVFPLADAGPYYAGLWSGVPNYKCPYCSYATLARSPNEGNGAIELHILAALDRGGHTAERHLKALEKKEV